MNTWSATTRQLKTTESWKSKTKSSISASRLWTSSTIKDFLISCLVSPSLIKIRDHIFSSICNLWWKLISQEMLRNSRVRWLSIRLLSRRYVLILISGFKKLSKRKNWILPGYQKRLNLILSPFCLIWICMRTPISLQTLLNFLSAISLKRKRSSI